MSTSFRMVRHRIAFYLLLSLTLATVMISCSKPGEEYRNTNQPFSYSSDVVDKWMTMQIRLMRNSVGIPNHGLGRHFAYSGVAALESIKPGIPAQSKWSSKLNGLGGLPIAPHGKKFYYPANVNAALAAMNRSMFPNANATDKLAIDSLENALLTEFLLNETEEIVSSSANFGKAVAAAVFAWSETDGFKNANMPYSVPTGAGLWKPTAPAFAPPATPYWGNNRPIFTTSTANTSVAPPPAYSTDPSSPFYQMVKQVYDVSQTLTNDQRAMAIFWRDVPGVSSPGHWLSILQQIIHQQQPALDKSVLAYALTGIGINDALVACFKTKYQYNLVRPITYIHEVMGHTTWTPVLGTPAHPEYSSAHSSLSAAAAEVLKRLFTVNSFTDHTYDYLGYAPRTYSSLVAIGDEAGQSRLYAGIHYQLSINIGLQQGKKVADNIFKNEDVQ